MINQIKSNQLNGADNDVVVESLVLRLSPPAKSEMSLGGRCWVTYIRFLQVKYLYYGMPGVVAEKVGIYVPGG